MLKIWPVKSISQPVDLATFRSNAVVPPLFIHCCFSNCLWGVSVGSLFCIFVSFLVLQSFCWERELVALLLLVSECHVR